MPHLERRQLAEAVGHHLRSAGRRLKCWKPSLNDSPEKSPPASPTSLFGTPLHALPLSEKVEGVPQFLVEICEALRLHLHTEGLFRKSGSVTRIKALKAQLEAGESCLDAATPCDLAVLLKRFLWELPQPLIPVGLQEPLCRAQQHLAEAERTPLTLLLTCLLPRHCVCTLRYFCTFLRDVAARCHENKMDEVNLAMIFAPSLFPSCELSSALGVEQQLQLQVGAVQALISHASHIGKVPQFLLDKLHMPAPESDSGCWSLAGLGVARDELAERNWRLHRRSIGDMVNEVLSKLHMGPLTWELKVDSPCSSTLAPQTLFSAKRKAMELLVQEAKLGTKKRRPTVGPVGSDFSMDEARDPFDQPPGEAPVSHPEVIGDSPPELPSTAGGLHPCASLCRRKSSYQKHPQRKLSRRSAHSSPAPCKPQNMGHKSLHIFACGRKELLPRDPTTLDTTVPEPHSEYLVKRMVAEGKGLERHCFPPGWAQQPLPKCMEPNDGAPADNDPSPADGQSKPDLVPCMGPTCAKPCAKEPDLDGWCRSCRRGPLRLQQVLRRSLSWPDCLAGVEGRMDNPWGTAGAGSSLSHSGGSEVEPLDPSPGSQLSLQPLGTPEVCVTLAPVRLGAREDSSEPEEEQPNPSSLAQCLSRPNSTPKRHVKRLMLALPRSTAQTTGVSASKEAARGWRFRRSLSHESALPNRGQAQTLGQGDPGLHPPKSPLSSLWAYGRQIFGTRKHLSVLPRAVGLEGAM